ncbi:MAG: DUF5995 family protein [Actinomycetota bacterium]|nr:DUF5995 family protein [Actinomycetota bacterium]
MRISGGRRLAGAFMTAAVMLAPAAVVTGAATPAAAGKCPDGSLRCVDAVIREMRRRFKPLASSCDHDAIFALAYLRTTEEYRRTVAAQPDFFDDTAFVNTEDVVFADYYFRAYDAWHAGRRASVPPAWRIALEAADERGVTGAGNLLLGINAHINHDLPFVLAALLEERGMTTADGDSRKADHDKVNEILRRVQEPLLTEAARRFDPTIDDAQVDGTGLDDEALFQSIVVWRERAWNNAVQLVEATTDAERRLVADSIAQQAANEATAIRADSSYGTPPNPPDSSARDDYCATHWRG